MTQVETITVLDIYAKKSNLQKYFNFEWSLFTFYDDI